MRKAHNELMSKVKMTTEKLMDEGMSVAESKSKIFEILNKYRSDIDYGNVLMALHELHILAPTFKTRF